MRPESEAELAAMIKDAVAPLHIKGGGTREIGQPVTGAVLETGGLSGITLYEPGALTIVAGAGTPLAEVEAALDAEGQRLAFEPMDHRGLLGTVGTPTLGGVVAGNVSGPRRIQSGAARDFMLGVRFVDGRGTILKNGGRVMKNVTGYDLVKLMAGSRGTLGVVSQVSLKVLPKPESAATLVFQGLTDGEAVKVMNAALGSPFEITGAAHAPGADGATWLRIEGFEKSVDYRAGRLHALFSAYSPRIVTSTDEVSAIWQAVRDVDVMKGQSGDVWRLSVKPSQAADLAARLRAKALLYDWGGGLIWALLADGTDARAHLGGFDGHATLVRGSAQHRAALGVFQPESAPLARLSQGLRARFDPRGLLNPGLMGG
ncbi:glycolate oxidase subunit GlcE [Puniceibacterium sp. IMCC21224]|uniref:glycolate oxidase subunit GlcE n=1 Tax=Puniceibacterium sp. IMCC21224 TaxID=1618204 RepID=UPI00064DD535|nr:glycolate oxidase subunit GlcE [Puniceibacterium sp. IMCC21224]KMK65594.1 FAD/FMN-dependent dehydrogenase [Puniceibacterium sp. IMCC21224]